MYQINDRFITADRGDEDYEYAEMQLIVCKAIKIPPKTGANTSDDIMAECAYVDGVLDDTYNTCAVRID